MDPSVQMVSTSDPPDTEPPLKVRGDTSASEMDTTGDTRNINPDSTELDQEGDEQFVDSDCEHIQIAENVQKNGDPLEINTPVEPQSEPSYEPPAVQSQQDSGHLQVPANLILETQEHCHFEDISDDNIDLNQVDDQNRVEEIGSESHFVESTTGKSTNSTPPHEDNIPEDLNSSVDAINSQIETEDIGENISENQDIIEDVHDVPVLHSVDFQDTGSVPADDTPNEGFFNFEQYDSDAISNQDVESHNFGEYLDNVALEGAEEIIQNDHQCSAVMKDLWQQTENADNLCDITIFVNGHNYKAHKCVLSTTGDYFKSVLITEQSGLIDLTPIVSSPKIFEVILEYIYTGRLMLSMSNVADFMDCCHKLGIPDVNKFCTRHLLKNITLATWHHILGLAIKFNLEEVEQGIIQFLGINLPKVYKSKHFGSFDEEALTQILGQCTYKKSCKFEQAKLDMILLWAIHDYPTRNKVFSIFFNCVNFKLLTKAAVEQTFGQKQIRHHAIFEDEATVTFLDQMQHFLEEKKVGRRRKTMSPQKVTSRHSKAINYSVMANGEDVHEAGPNLTTSGDQPPKRKRGRPPKVKPAQTTIVSKRPRGRPRKDLFSHTMKKDTTPDVTEKEPKDIAEPTEDGEAEITRPEDSNIETPEKIPGSPTVPQQKINKCLECGKCFPTRRKLRRHVLIHREKTIACDLCDYRTSRRDKVREHQRRVHPAYAAERGLATVKTELKEKAPGPEKKPRRVGKRGRKKLILKEEDMHQCPKCPRKFSSLSLLAHHKKGHGSDIPFLCELCGFSTKHYASINIHKRQHNGNKFRCTFPGCSYENIRKSRLEDHLNAHKGLKNHVCSVCGKAFAGRKHMQRHEKLHVDHKPFSCDTCDYQSVRRDKLNAHIRKHHPHVAILMGILTPDKLAALKAAEESKPPRVRKPKQKKKLKKEDEESSLLIDEAVDQRLPTEDVLVQQTDQSANYVAMSVPSHLLGASTISEEMIQYLASMTSSGLVTSHQQIQVANNTPAPGGSQQVQVVQGAPSNLLGGSHQMVRPNQPAVAEQRNDTWVYHIVPDGQQY